MVSSLLLSDPCALTAAWNANALQHVSRRRVGRPTRTRVHLDQTLQIHTLPWLVFRPFLNSRANASTSSIKNSPMGFCPALTILALYSSYADTRLCCSTACGRFPVLP